MPYDSTSRRDRERVAGHLSNRFGDRVPRRAVDTWIAVWDDVHGRHGDESRAFAAANAVVNRRFAVEAAPSHPAYAAFVGRAAAGLASVFGRRALRELELTLQNCDCGKDHERTLRIVQTALRLANAGLAQPQSQSQPSGSLGARRAAGGPAGASDPFESASTRQAGVNVAWAWAVVARDIYANGDKVFLSVREMLQNSRDAKAKKIEITWDWEEGVDEQGTLTFRDDGMGMNLEVFTEKFMNIGESQKPEGSLGGFGAAKAAILTASSTGWSWRVRTNDVVARSMEKGSYQAVQVPSADAIRGTEIVIPHVKGNDMQTPMGSGGPVARITNILACSDLRGLDVYLNGARVESYYEGRRGQNTDIEIRWGAIEPGIKRYARKEKKNGAIIVRVKGLAQFAVVPPYGSELPSDYVLDFEIPAGLQPNDHGYPFKSGRDSFRYGTDAFYAFERFRDAIFIKAAKAEKDMGEYEEIRPDATDARERKAQAQLDGMLEDVMGAKSFQDTLADLGALSEEMTHAVKKFEQAVATRKPEPDEAAQGQPQPRGGRPTIANELTAQSRDLLDSLLSNDFEAQIVRLTALAEKTLANEDTVGFQNAMDRLSRRKGWAEDLETVAVTVRGILKRLDPGTSPLIVAAIVSQIMLVMEHGIAPVEQEAVEIKKKRGDLNPFGGAACIFVHRERFGEERGKQFRKKAKKYFKILVAWDFVVRALLQANATAGRFPEVEGLGVGFVLDPDVFGLTDKTGKFVMINPTKFQGVVETYRERAFVVAAWIHQLAVHEIAHAMQISTSSNGSHDQKWSVMRENFADETLFLLPVIEDALAKLLKLKRRTRAPRGVGAAALERVQALEASLAQAQVTIDELRASEGQRTRLGLGKLAHRVEHLANLWEFQEWVYRNRNALPAGTGAEEIVAHLNEPGSVERLLELMEAEEQVAWSVAGRRAGAGVYDDAKAAVREVSGDFGAPQAEIEPACPDCGGTCGAAKPAHRVKVSGDVLVDWSATEVDTLPGDASEGQQQFAAAVAHALDHGHPEIELTDAALAYFRSPTGPVHGSSGPGDRLEQATKASAYGGLYGADQDDVDRAKRVLKEVRALARKYPAVRVAPTHAACGCGSGKIVVIDPKRERETRETPPFRFPM